jgi:hypothetical protein
MVLHKWVSQSKLTKLAIFKASLEKLQCKSHRIPPEHGRGDAYLSFGSILDPFGG